MRNPEAARGRVVKRNRTLGAGDLGVTAARGLSTCRYQKLVHRVAVERDALAGGESPACSTSFAACSVPSALPCGRTEPSPSKTLPCGISSQCSSEGPKDGPTDTR